MQNGDFLTGEKDVNLELSANYDSSKNTDAKERNYTGLTCFDQQ